MKFAFMSYDLEIMGLLFLFLFLSLLILMVMVKIHKHRTRLETIEKHLNIPEKK
jgi:cell division protein FtsL